MIRDALADGGEFPLDLAAVDRRARPDARTGPAGTPQFLVGRYLMNRGQAESARKYLQPAAELRSPTHLAQDDRRRLGARRWMQRRRAEAGIREESEQDPEIDTEMNTARFQISVRRMMAAVAVAAVGLSLASSYQTSSLSCHLCHNRKHVDSRLVLGVPVSWREIMDTQFPASPDHRHIWWRYATGTSSLLLGSRAAGSDRRYADGSTAPDGRP